MTELIQLISNDLKYDGEEGKGLACPSVRATLGKNGAAAAANGFIQYFHLPPKCHIAVHLWTNTTVNLRALLETRQSRGGDRVPVERGGRQGGEFDDFRASSSRKRSRTNEDVRRNGASKAPCPHALPPTSETASSVPSIPP